jgi:hypothetical protein
MAIVQQYLRESDNAVLFSLDDTGLLTILGNLSFAAGASATFRRVLLNITATQLKAIKATPLTVVAAPGAGLALMPTMIAYYYRFLTTAFTLNAGALRLFQGPVANAIPIHADVAAGTIDQAANRTVLCPPILKQGPASDANLVNQPITIANDGAAEFTLGLGSLDVVLIYGIHTL